MSAEFFQQLAGISILFYAFLLLGGIWITKKIQRPVLFLLLFGILQGATYFLLTKGTSLPFWGLIGDEIFVTALFEQAANGGVFQDFAYAHLPPFYPPLFFWIFAPIGNLLSLNGVQLYKIANLATFVFFPVIFYGILRFVAKQYPELKLLQSKLTAVLASVFLFFFPAIHNIIHKSYEFTSAALMIVWTLAVAAEAKRGKWKWKRMVVLGLCGGILFLWFYFWLFFAALAVLLYLLFQKQNTPVRTYGWLILVGLIVLIGASPYLLPLIQTYAELGAENWQSGFSVAERLAVHGPFLGDLSLLSLIMLALFAGLMWLRKTLTGALLLAVYATPFLWQLLGSVTIFFFASPLQESKGFLYVHDAIYALLAGIFLQKLYLYIQSRKKLQQWNFPIAAVLLWITAVGLIFGSWRSDPQIMGVQSRAVLNSDVQVVIDYVEQNNPTALTLHSGIMELYATTPLNTLIYFNQHASHPAAHYSERKLWIKKAARISDSSELAQAFRESPYGPVERFIFFKNAEPNHYVIYLHSDGYPNGILEEGIRFEKGLFDSPEFDMILENKRYIVFELGQN